jgi:hypothetical protein
MALKSPAFRRKFPLLVTGSLLAMQPFATSFVVAAEQYDCSVSASGAWDCAPKASAAPLPPRPVHDGSAVSSATARRKAKLLVPKPYRRPSWSPNPRAVACVRAVPTTATWTGSLEKTSPQRNWPKPVLIAPVRTSSRPVLA